ncbi:MAG TPA: hypothetical protein VGG32_00715 [Thermoplasmata archaeon]
MSVKPGYLVEREHVGHLTYEPPLCQQEEERLRRLREGTARRAREVEDRRTLAKEKNNHEQ